MACPYFIPAEPHERELWPQRHRLPLGDGFAGRCGGCAPESNCDDETLRSGCNLGYAECVHLPAEREFDAVRFQVQSESSTTLQIQFACERAHRPALVGELHFDLASMSWKGQPDPRLLHLAEAAVRAWTGKHGHGVEPERRVKIATD